MCNRAFAGLPVHNTCSYDTRATPDVVLATAELTHPYLHRGGVRGTNPSYIDPTELLRLPTTDTEAPPVDPALCITDGHDLGQVRARLRNLLSGHFVREPAATELVHVVHELVCNGVLHGAPPVSVRVWLPLGRVVCAVTDLGAGFDGSGEHVKLGSDPQLAPGMGLRLVRGLSDDITAARNAEGFTVRVVKDL
jgi:anti-sigma regulatory factor (Ser/Thr protein kinase)